MKRDEPFRIPAFPSTWSPVWRPGDLADVKRMIDRSLAARNRGKFVIDLNSSSGQGGNSWLRTAALLLPPIASSWMKPTASSTIRKRDWLRLLGIQ